MRIPGGTAWNAAALRLLDIPVDSTVGAVLVADTERRLRRRLPAAVGEWFRAGADRRLAQLSDNHITDLASPGKPDHARFLDAGLLLLETDSQYCCRWVTPLDGGDNPVIYLIDPDDFAGESRSPYADSFTAYTEADAWDARLYRTEDAAWSFDHELNPDAVGMLAAMLDRRPSTFGWAHNQGCDAVHRFDGPARVAIAVTGETAAWTVVSTVDPALRSEIAGVLGVPPDDRS
jgi:hypothetical protein